MDTIDVEAPGSAAETLYASALDVAKQWFDNYHVTHDRRHLLTALTCAAIAAERYTIVAAERRRFALTDAPERVEQAALAAHVAHLAKTLGDMAG